MRIHYTDLTRPKQAAKRIARLFPDKALNIVQQAVAVAVGYTDWYELNKTYNATPPSTLDQGLSPEEFHDRLFAIIDKLAKELNVPDGDAQYAVSQTRLTGDRPLTFEDHEAIRTRFWRAYPMPWLGKNRVGATCYIKDKGFPPGRAYQKHHDDLIYYATDSALMGARTREEIRVPRERMPDFIPLRLWLPYGWWTCADGSVVYFSRDYMPMWRVRPETKPERLVPWLWVTGIQEHGWFGRDGTWFRPPAIAAAKAKLNEAGIVALPILADALPTVVNGGDIEGKEVVKFMKDRIAAGESSYYALRSPHLHLAPNSFFEFVMNQRRDSSPAGDFIGDAQQDPTFPSAKSWAELKNYLFFKGASDAAINAARLVWRAFESSVASV